MQFRKDRYGNDISVLGYGCMRFSRRGTGVDLDKTEKEILEAVGLGVNYFDTAYIYPGSEAALGEIVRRNDLRGKIFIASKLPHYLIRNRESLDKYFNEQLSRLGTDHIDYYLMHMLTDVRTWDRLKEFDIEEWIAQKKSSGQIRQIGFSYHGSTDEFVKLLNAYDWEFTQIQYNYMDENSQAGMAGLKAAAAKGLPVVIMEPLRGGRLVNMLPQEAARVIAADKKGRSAAELAFDWLWDQEEVTCVLSGMNSVEMVRQNAKAAERSRPGMFSDEDRELIKKITEIFNEKIKIPCTGCRYCMPCPQGVDIPGTFAAYNRLYTENWFAGMKEHVMTTAARRNSAAASKCVKCGKCEQHCPQELKIRDLLEQSAKKLEGPLYKAGTFVMTKIMKY